MKRISKAKRAFLLAVVRGKVCDDCRSVAGEWWWFNMARWVCSPCWWRRER